MKILKYLDESIEEILLVFLLSSTSILTFLQVIMRYIAKSPLSWSEELSRYMFIWLIYIGVSYGVKKSAHIKVDFLMNIFPRPIRKFVLIISDIIFMGFSLFIVVTGYQVATKILSLGQKSPALGLQMGYVYFATVVGFGLTFIRLLQQFRKHITPGDETIELGHGGE